MSRTLWRRLLFLLRRERLDRELEMTRVLAWLAAGLGALSLVLAAVGIGALAAFAVSARTHQIGVRVALGARSRDVVRLILAQALRPVLAGVGVGLASAAATSHLMRGFLYGLSPLDPVTFAGVSLFLAAFALLAVLIPARRATAIDPIVVLRHE